MAVSPAPPLAGRTRPEAEHQARALLLRNLTPAGLLAATAGPRAAARRYTRIFGRDAAISALGMAHSGDPRLIAGAVAGLVSLARQQAPSGQIPKFVDAEQQEADFWYLGCIDASLWWLLAIDHLDRICATDLRQRLAPQISAALGWLRAQEHPDLGLLQQNEASDWADIFPRSGYVLYSNALWYAVKRRYAQPDADHTRDQANRLFRPRPQARSANRRLRLLIHYAARSRDPDDPIYLSYVNLGHCGHEGDVFANLLAVCSGLCPPSEGGRLLDALARAGVDTPHPVRAVCRPIAPTDPAWRPYMGRHQQNLPFQYHNGGAWPFIGGFWVVAQALCGRRQLAEQAFDQLIASNRAGGYEFNEWFHGESGQPSGMPGQSWNAAMQLAAQAALARPTLL